MKNIEQLGQLPYFIKLEMSLLELKHNQRCQMYDNCRTCTTIHALVLPTTQCCTTYDILIYLANLYDFSVHMYVIFDRLLFF